MNMTRIKVNNSGKSQTRASFTFCRMTSLKEKLKKKNPNRKTKKRKKNWNRWCFVEWCQREGQRRRYRMACACMLYGCCASVNNTKKYMFKTNANKICCTCDARCRANAFAPSFVPSAVCCASKKIIKMTRLHLLRKYFYLKETPKKRYIAMETYGGEKKKKRRASDRC